MKANGTHRYFLQHLLKIFLGLFIVIGFNQSGNAQFDCAHLSMDYNVSSSYYALGVSNNSLEESSFIVEINNATYLLDGTEFSNADGIQLTVETTTNADGTYNHTLTPDQPIGAYQYLNFVYNGVPTSSNNDYTANAEVYCSFAYIPLCSNLEFNFFSETQFYWGFGIQNNNSTAYFPYEVHINDASYQFDLSQLDYTGFDFFQTDNGNGTYDYYFVAQDPIEPYASSPIVSTNQDLGGNLTSNGAAINCGDAIVSSGSNGGLESHGGLASKIALRNFKRAIGKETNPGFRSDNKIISDLAPQHIIKGDKLQEASPMDLIEITAAETIWAGDYFINDRRYASIFGSKTSEEVYDHTKVICDRVKGSELMAVEVLNIEGYEMILSIIQRPNKTIEHAISFSLAYEEFGNFTMASHWATDEYRTSPNFLNYQVWTNSKAKSVAAVANIIENIKKEDSFTLNQANKSPTIPKLFAKRAHYKLGKFHLELNNRLSEATSVKISGMCTSKEVNGVKNTFNKEINILPGQNSLTITLPNGNVFDGELTIQAGDDQKDHIYLADGSWGLEYDEFSTSIDNLEIVPEERTEEHDTYIVERGIEVSGNTDSYVSIFKQLVPGGLAVDLSEYNTVSFDSKRHGVYEITLLMDGETDPSHHESHTLKADAQSSVDIPFALFTNESGDQLDPTKITTIYIAFIADNNQTEDFNLSIENIHFNYQTDSEFNIDQNELGLFPNPTSGLVNVTHKFVENTDVLIRIYDAKGTIVQQVSAKAFKGLQTFELSVEGAEQGVYLISLLANDRAYTSKLLLSN